MTLWLLTATCLKPADGSPILHIEQDIVLGCYYLTYDRLECRQSRLFTALLQKSFWRWMPAPLATKRRCAYLPRCIDTTAGRIIFNEVFPEDFPYHNDVMTKKRLQAVMAEVYAGYGQEKTAEIADALKDLGFGTLPALAWHGYERL